MMKVILASILRMIRLCGLFTIVTTGLLASAALATPARNAQYPSNQYLSKLGAPLVAYGQTLLLAGYTGPALQVKRSSDGAVLDIGFHGQVLDVATAQAFAGSSTLAVTKVYAQDGVSAPLTSEPGLEPLLVMVPGSAPVIMFNQGWQRRSHYLKLPASFAPDRGNFSMFLTARFAAGRNSNALLDFTDGLNSQFGLFNIYNHNSLAAVVDGSELLPADPARMLGTSTPGIVGVVSSPSGLMFHRDQLIRKGPAVSSLILDRGGYLFSSHQPGSFGRGDMFSVIFVNQALSDADAEVLKSELNAIHSTNSFRPTAHVFIQGDSITEGVAAPSNYSLTRALEPVLHDAGIVIHNFGLSGDCLSDTVDIWSKSAPIEPGIPNILMVWLGSNDIALEGTPRGSSVSQLWANMALYISEARAAGFTRIIGVTVLPRGDILAPFDATGQKETNRQAFNRLVRSNPQGYFDEVWDVDALTNDAQPLSGYLIRASLSPDRLHPSELAYALMAPSLGVVMRSMVP